MGVRRVAAKTNCNITSGGGDDNGARLEKKKKGEKRKKRGRKKRVLQSVREERVRFQ